jgi:hypothetical protein
MGWNLGVMVFETGYDYGWWELRKRGLWREIGAYLDVWNSIGRNVSRTTFFGIIFRNFLHARFGRYIKL